jgi:anthranilate synthase component 1
MSQRTYIPSPQDFGGFLASSKLIPVCTEIIADLDTPLTLFAKIADNHSHIFLFESMEGGEKWGRYSFIGFDPLVTFASRQDQVSVTEVCRGEKTTETSQANPLQAIKALVERLRAAEFAGLPKFCGGAVGFLGYDMVRFMEDLPDNRPVLDLPDSAFMVPRIVLVHDSFRQTVTVVCWVRVDDAADGNTLYQEAVQRIEEITAILKAPVPLHAHKSTTGVLPPHVFASNMTADRFHSMVERAKEYILAGDIIQVVLSQRFHAEKIGRASCRERVS